MSGADVIDTLAGLAPDSAAGGDPGPQAGDPRPGAGELPRAVRAGRGRVGVAAGTVSRWPCSSPGCMARRTIAGFYAAGLARCGTAADVLVAALDGAKSPAAATTGPYGAFPTGPLSVEDVDRASVSAGRIAPGLGARLTAASGARAHAGVSSARCPCRVAAGFAGCRLVERRHRHAVATGGVPGVPDPCRRSGLRVLAATACHDRDRRHPSGQSGAGGVHPGDAGLAAVAASRRPRRR